MDIHPRVWMPGLMELRLGILCNVQAHFLLTHIPLGVAWPQWDACFPQVAVSDAPPQCRGRGAGRPSFAQWAGLEKQTPTQACTSHTHTHIHSVHTLRVCSPLWRKFWHEQLLRVREWQVYSRFQQAHRGEAGWQSSGITLGSRQCAGLSELPVCLPLFFPLRAF